MVDLAVKHFQRHIMVGYSFPSMAVYLCFFRANMWLKRQWTLVTVSGREHMIWNDQQLNKISTLKVSVMMTSDFALA